MTMTFVVIMMMVMNDDDKDNDNCYDDDDNLGLLFWRYFSVSVLCSATPLAPSYRHIYKIIEVYEQSLSRQIYKIMIDRGMSKNSSRHFYQIIHLKF